MRVVSIIGLLGAGKSTMVRRLLEEAEHRGLAAGAVINESGPTAFDDEGLRDRFPIRAIGGG